MSKYTCLACEKEFKDWGDVKKHHGIECEGTFKGDLIDD